MTLYFIFSRNSLDVKYKLNIGHFLVRKASCRVYHVFKRFNMYKMTNKFGGDVKSTYRYGYRRISDFITSLIGHLRN